MIPPLNPRTSPATLPAWVVVLASILAMSMAKTWQTLLFLFEESAGSRF
ncbi:MAG TPA: hypothetical protein VFH95_16185 [Candidatus Kapabacteria bacterium]|nr:hypothetical protein [Candidatus Kapabacteria bacterium]